MDSQRDFLATRYQQLWDESFESVRQGQVVIDPVLALGEADQRRCLTVLIRPSAAIQDSVNAFLDELRGVDPEQYYYGTSELHVTVLSLFTATLDHGRLLTRYDDYLAAVTAVLSQARSFEIEFTGVTLSREAIIIQGFPSNTVLDDLRGALREELRTHNLTEGLDGRYLLQTAHMTAVRFREPLRDSVSFGKIVTAHRDRCFGTTKVQELDLVRNDWSMSRQSVEVLQSYDCGAD